MKMLAGIEKKFHNSSGEWGVILISTFLDPLKLFSMYNKNNIIMIVITKSRNKHLLKI